MGFFQDIFKQKTKLYTQPRASLGTSTIAMHNRRYADIVLQSIVGQIFNCVDTIELYQNGNYIVEDARIANARAIITLHFREMFWDLFNKGYFVLLMRGDEFEYLPAKYVSKIGNDGYVTTELEGRVEARVFYEKNYSSTNKTMLQVCQSTLDYIDNVLNTATTGNAKLGNVTILTPTTNAMGSEVLRDNEKKEIEKLISESYGGLDSQSNLMLFPNSLSTTTISFDFAKLQILPQFQLGVQNLCSYFNVPYDILPTSGQSTFNNQENAYSMLYATAERWVMDLQRYFAELGVDFEFELKGKPNTEKVKAEQAKKDAVATMAQAVSSGLMTIEEARNELKQHYNI